jgi:nitroimidazol reductase NimA-like FMN-containing flavoprotein (pyridoxamine 5'-phosphate oxidase superfamily)
MEIVENSMEVPLEAVLERPLFCFFATTDEGLPRISPLWYLWEDGTVWIIADDGKTYVDRVRKTPHAALAMVDFLPGSGVVRHVGFRGMATVEPFDEERADRLLRRYLGPNPGTWDERFKSPWSDRWQFIRFEPETVVARDQSYDVGTL